MKKLLDILIDLGSGLAIVGVCIGVIYLCVFSGINKNDVADMTVDKEATSYTRDTNWDTNTSSITFKKKSLDISESGDTPDTDYDEVLDSVISDLSSVTSTEVSDIPSTVEPEDVSDVSDIPTEDTVEIPTEDEVSDVEPTVDEVVTSTKVEEVSESVEEPTSEDAEPLEVLNASGGGNIEDESNLHISDFLVIGDSNTVRMYNQATSILGAKYVAAVTAVGVRTWDRYKNTDSTIGDNTIKSCLEELSDDYFDNVLILLGTNDYSTSHDNFLIGYLSILKYIFTRNEDAFICISTIPPVRDSASSTITNLDATQVSNWIKEVVELVDSSNVRLVDLNSCLNQEDMSDVSGSGYHLNSNGAIRASNYLCAVVQSFQS